ncbi:MAG: DUF1992 domain-containing protein [Bacteroidales bacterium]|nr:MAG: DUF1992 domain-containing protein [Bacteroidales bacterium]
MGNFDKVVEKKIKEAIENNEFDNLEGFGKPLDNSEYFNSPEEDRVAFHIMKNAGIVPEELKIRKEINHLIKEIKDCTDKTEKEKLKKELSMLYTEFELVMEQKKLKKTK